MNPSKFLRPFLKKWVSFARPQSTDSFLTGAASQYIEDMYTAWLKDPNSVHVSWNSYFTNTSQGLAHPQINPGGSDQNSPDKAIKDHLEVLGIIRSYQARGHLVAQIDPLGIMETVSSSELVRYNKLEKVDQNKVYTLPENTFIGGTEKQLPLKEILKRLEAAYCESIGVEYIYIDDLAERTFIRQKMETPGIMKLTPEQKKRTLKRIIRTSDFENFLSKKWTSEKRFGIEGCDMVIPLIKQIIDKSTEFGVEHFFIGIAHRGRLSLLANVFRKPLYQIFNQFVPLEPGDIGSGDVKYHFGSHTERTSRVTQKKYKLTLLANPSHLEAVNGTVIGRTRAEQVFKGDDHGKKSLAILIHGDAAFCGQGVNYEGLTMSYLPNYTTHGVICIIINNQVGFTTDPRFSRSSRYCSDLGRVVNAPIFHVNADKTESVIHVANVAAEYRAKFGKDLVIDLVGYRRYGHNEADEPSFTQPFMYKKIAKLDPVAKQYQNQLIEEKIVTKEEVKKIEDDYLKLCEEQYAKASQQTQVFIRDWLDSPWEGFLEGKSAQKNLTTGISESTLSHIAQKFSSLPPESLDFVIHKGLVRLLSIRKTLADERMADWAMGEAFAIGSLVKEGIPVRLSGEDVERGTFSHRHHVLHHQTVDKVTYEALNDLYSDQAKYTVCNSSLCEYGVLSFEVGYAQANPNCLVIWEAQFGDFFNTAQCVFDQFLSSGETKWARQNGVVCLLPHGFEGMGPEHSSARIERFLQMCSDDPDLVPENSPMEQLQNCNWIVANCSTPANLFHLLRRQIYLPFRKPVIVFTPKSLLRLPACRSSFDEFLEGTDFKRAIPEQGEASKNPGDVKRLLFCSGKAYYDIVEARKKRNLEKVIAVCRIEQYAPFPYDIVKAECEKYSKATLVWAQEEPKNNGAYAYCVARMNSLLKRQRGIEYVGRAAAAAPATGTKAQHKKEVAMLDNAYGQI